jgi:RecA/RadA recombinase
MCTAGQGSLSITETTTGRAVAHYAAMQRVWVRISAEGTRAHGPRLSMRILAPTNPAIPHSTSSDFDILKLPPARPRPRAKPCRTLDDNPATLSTAEAPGGGKEDTRAGQRGRTDELIHPGNALMRVLENSGGVGEVRESGEGLWGGPCQLAVAVGSELVERPGFCEREDLAEEACGKLAEAGRYALLALRYRPEDKRDRTLVRVERARKLLEEAESLLGRVQVTTGA